MHSPLLPTVGRFLALPRLFLALLDCLSELSPVCPQFKSFKEVEVESKRAGKLGKAAAGSRAVRSISRAGYHIYEGAGAGAGKLLDSRQAVVARQVTETYEELCGLHRQIIGKRVARVLLFKPPADGDLGPALEVFQAGQAAVAAAIVTASELRPLYRAERPQKISQVGLPLPPPRCPSVPASSPRPWVSVCPDRFVHRVRWQLTELDSDEVALLPRGTTFAPTASQVNEAGQLRLRVLLQVRSITRTRRPPACLFGTGGRSGFRISSADWLRGDCIFIASPLPLHCLSTVYAANMECPPT